MRGLVLTSQARRHFLALTETLKIVHGSPYFHLHKPTKNVKILTWKAMASGEIHGGGGAGRLLLPQDGESLVMHCAKPSVYFSNYGFLCLQQLCASLFA